jgi:hypothetical protein
LATKWLSFLSFSSLFFVQKLKSDYEDNLNGDDLFYSLSMFVTISTTLLLKPV